MASKTLRELTGRPSEPSALNDAVLILIDCQNTYTQGVMELEGHAEAIQQAERLLTAARAAKRPIIHVVHEAGAGTPYDTAAPIGQIVDALKPLDGEPTITKNVPSSFANTDLHERLQKLESKELILAGFMTHMCVSSTARSGCELGYRCTVVAGATATRPLPATPPVAGGSGGVVVDAKTLKASALAAIGDMFAVVVETVDDLKQ